MRIQDGTVYSLDTGGLVPVGQDLLTDVGDVEVVPHDLSATLRVCSDAVGAAVARGRVPIVLGGDDSLLFASVRGLQAECTAAAGEAAPFQCFSLLIRTGALPKCQSSEFAQSCSSLFR